MPRKSEASTWEETQGDRKKVGRGKAEAQEEALLVYLQEGAEQLPGSATGGHPRSTEEPARLPEGI